MNLRTPIAAAIAALSLAACTAGGPSPEPASTSGSTNTPPSAALTAIPSSSPTGTQTIGLPNLTGRIAFGRITGEGMYGEQLMALFAMNADGSDLVQLTDDNSYIPVWSLDGARLAFTLYEPEDGSAQVATIAADGTDLTVLTSGPGIHAAGSWSPDGTWIAYEASDQTPGDTGFHTVLWRMDADGSNQTRLGSSDAFDYLPRISPDGASVLFQRYLDDGSESLLLLDVATGEERILTEHRAINADWAPDGLSIVAQTESSAGAHWGPVVRIAIDDPAESAWIELFPGGDESGGFKPVHSPDGAKIAFGCVRPEVSRSEAICVMNDDGTDVQTLVDDPTSDENEVSWGRAPG